MTRVVFVNVGFPHALDYPEARPIKLAVEAGYEVHAVSLARQGHVGFPGVCHWFEASLTRMAWRTTRLGGKVTFFERPGRLLVAAGLVGNAWVRAPERVVSRRKQSVLALAMTRVQTVSFTNPWEEGLWKIAPDRLCSLAYPVDVDFWSEATTTDPGLLLRLGLEGKPGALLCSVGNLMARKQQVELVSWCAPLLRSQRDTALVLAGTEVEDGVADAVRATARGEGIADQVLLAGGLSRDSCRELFAAADLHVVNSNNETQCMAMYEGLAAGVATLVYDNPVLTSAFPFLPVHSDALSFLRNATAVLGDSSAGTRQRELGRARLEWADSHRHDELFLEHLAALVSR